MDFEQRVYIKFCLKLEKSAKEAYVTLKSVYGDDVIILNTIYMWYKRFQSGNDYVVDD